MVKLAVAAAYAKVPIATMRGWIRRGWLPAYRIGPRQLQVDMADVEALRTRRPQLEHVARRRAALDVEFARKRLRAFGPPWRYAPTGAAVHLSTEYLAGLDEPQAICGAPLDQKPGPTTRTGRDTTCPDCRVRVQVVAELLAALGIDWPAEEITASSSQRPSSKRKKPGR